MNNTHTKLYIPYVETWEETGIETLRVLEFEDAHPKAYFTENIGEIVTFDGTVTYGDLLNLNPVCIAYYNVGKREGRLTDLLE